MILPFKLDVKILKFPFWTLFISSLCVFLHYYFENKELVVSHNTRVFCAENIQFYKSLSDIPSFAYSSCYDLMRDLVVTKDFEVNLNLIPALGQDLKDELMKIYTTYYDQNAIYSKDYYASYSENFSILRFITSSFIHHDWRHLASNIYTLLLFGLGVELVIGSLNYILFIIGSSLFTSGFFYFTSDEISLSMGASGFIFAILGLVIVLLRKVNIHTFIFLFLSFRVILIPAWIVIGLEIVLNIYTFISGTDENVNFTAHFSGALFGIILGGTLFKKYQHEPTIQ